VEEEDRVWVVQHVPQRRAAGTGVERDGDADGPEDAEEGVDEAMVVAEEQRNPVPRPHAGGAQGGGGGACGAGEVGVADAFLGLPDRDGLRVVRAAGQEADGGVLGGGHVAHRGMTAFPMTERSSRRRAAGRTSSSGAVPAM